MKVLRPLDISANVDPCVFLAGPIQGAPQWHDKAIEILGSQLHYTNTEIASPRTPGPWHGQYEEQVEWETHYLQKASRTGVILFWLANKAEDHPDRCYGQTSRFEIGEWITKCLWSRSTFDGRRKRLVIGIEPGFSGERYIRTRVGKSFRIFDRLDETCHEVVKRLYL